MKSAYLYNCLPDNTAPEWSRFKGIEIECCVTHCRDCGKIVIPVAFVPGPTMFKTCECGVHAETVTESGAKPEARGAFWTVYGRYDDDDKDDSGLAVAITDVGSRDEAEAIADLFTAMEFQCDGRVKALNYAVEAVAHTTNEVEDTLKGVREYASRLPFEGAADDIGAILDALADWRKATQAFLAQA